MLSYSTLYTVLQHQGITIHLVIENCVERLYLVLYQATVVSLVDAKC